MGKQVSELRLSAQHNQQDGWQSAEPSMNIKKKQNTLEIHSYSYVQLSCESTMWLVSNDYM